MYILFDIGGTKTRVSASKDLETFCEPVKFETPNNFGEGVAKIVEAAKSLARDEKVEMIGGGIRGPLNEGKNTLLSEVVLTDWVGKNITEALSNELGCDACLENDTAVVGLGEAHYGSGKDFNIMVYHTVSTGVGGVRIIDGKVAPAAVGFEPGKQIIDTDHTMCPKCDSGSLEDMISGTSLEKRFNTKPYDIPQDDKVWDQLANWFSYGLKNTITYWSPDGIVLGGSMIVGDPRIFLEDIIRHTEERLDGLVPCPPMVDAALGDEGGLYGAMALIKQQKG